MLHVVRCVTETDSPGCQRAEQVPWPSEGPCVCMQCNPSVPISSSFHFISSHFTSCRDTLP